MSDYITNFRRSEPKPMWSYPLSLVEYEAEIEMLKSRIAELEWNNSELTDENAELEQRIAELEFERSWIPVEERLPELLDRVLLRYSEKTWIGWRYGEGINCYDTYDKSVSYCAIPTHWMPLPNPLYGGEG